MKAELHQYFTPAWAAQELVESTWPGLRHGTVMDACTGPGSFLAAIPASVDAFGFDIDPAMVQQAKANTGRDVYLGDALTFEPPRRPSIIISNPPFRAKIIRPLIARAERWLGPGCSMGLLLPAHFFKSAALTFNMQGRWGVTAQLLPYSQIFPMLKYPLVWAVFERHGTKMVGLALYGEAAAIQAMREQYREALKQPGNPWKQVVWLALKFLGGEADLQDIYRVIEPHRPTATDWWQQQVRKQLRNFTRVREGRYAVPA